MFEIVLGIDDVRMPAQVKRRLETFLCCPQPHLSRLRVAPITGARDGLGTASQDSRHATAQHVSTVSGFDVRHLRLDHAMDQDNSQHEVTSAARDRDETRKRHAQCCSWTREYAVPVSSALDEVK